MYCLVANVLSLQHREHEIDTKNVTPLLTFERFVQVYGYMAILICLFLATLCVINKVRFIVLLVL